MRIALVLWHSTLSFEMKNMLFRQSALYNMIKPYVYLNHYL